MKPTKFMSPRFRAKRKGSHIWYVIAKEDVLMHHRRAWSPSFLRTTTLVGADRRLRELVETFDTFEDGHKNSER